MHDALARYEADALDKEIADVEDPPFRPQLVDAQPIARPRVETKDLTVHVWIVDPATGIGWWHRLDPFTLDAACGAPAHMMNSERRPERMFAHPLSRTCGCFTKPELIRADADYRKKFGEDALRRLLAQPTP